MSKSIDLSHVYQSRNNFTVIGISGRSGSGCSSVANQLVMGFDDVKNFDDPFEIGLSELGFKHNEYRKYRIIYDYAKVNYQGFTLIKYKDVITYFIMQSTYRDFVDFLNSSSLVKEFKKSNLKLFPDFEKELLELKEFESEYERLRSKMLNIDVPNIKKKELQNWRDLYDFFFDTEFTQFSNKMHEILKSRSLLKRNKVLQIITNNLRKSGHAFNFKDFSTKNIFTIVEFINLLIKSNRKFNDRTQIVIDSLRNPIEIMFFRQRFSAFYNFAVNRNDESREFVLRGKYTMDNNEDVTKFIREEYKGGEDYEFYKQNVSACIQQADIHITFIESKDAHKKNFIIESSDKETPFHKDNTSPYFGWKIQLLKYVSLISHPGLITPSPEERCMQLAYTAKHNSGCISRHVGAAITDEFYSIKAIGWNSTPEGQVPCSLRNAEDLIKHTKDINAFTKYERKTGSEFGNESLFFYRLSEKFEDPINKNRKLLKGRTVCFCFKDIKNSFSEGKNQVHTRSLHAEESAFLQIAKYGGTGIKNGKLFTTASPCELCAKKAYQLGIKVIYYIDPYPGISEEHILSSGSNPIEIRLFNGAIGNTYHWLYDPIMPYKDEISLILGNKFKDLTSQYKSEVSEKDKIIAKKNKIITKKDKIISDLELQLANRK